MVRWNSSQSARNASLILRSMERSFERNRFLASCCVIDEPPCTTPDARALAMSARVGADDVDAEMLVEAPVLGGEHRLDEMVGQFLERDGIVVPDAALARPRCRSGPGRLTARSCSFSQLSSSTSRNAGIASVSISRRPPTESVSPSQARSDADALAAAHVETVHELRITVPRGRHGPAAVAERRRRPGVRTSRKRAPRAARASACRGNPTLSPSEFERRNRDGE